MPIQRYPSSVCARTETVPLAPSLAVQPAARTGQSSGRWLPRDAHSQQRLRARARNARTTYDEGLKGNDCLWKLVQTCAQHARNRTSPNISHNRLRETTGFVRFLTRLLNRFGGLLKFHQSTANSDNQSMSPIIRTKLAYNVLDVKLHSCFGDIQVRGNRLGS